MNRSEVLRTAGDIISGDRQQQYGPPGRLFAVIADLWSAYLGQELSKTDVAMLMALLKIARLKANPEHEDGWVDGVGYLALGAELATGK